MDSIRWLAELTAADLPIAGGKGANLGELVRAGFAVPDGFVITTGAYTDFVNRNGLDDRIRAAAAEVAAAPAGEPSTAGIGDLFATAELPAELADEITAAYRQLGDSVPVAVRSSATAEDLAEASFAGQQDTYLNVVGPEALLAAVRDCWASLWTDRAIRYRAEHGVDPGWVALAVVVQRLVQAEAAGVMFTSNPANGRPEETVITAAWGLGEAVVAGMVDTDTVVVGTSVGRVLSHQVADKAIRVDPVAGGTAEVPNPEEVRGAAVLDAADALQLAGIGAAIATHFGSPQDIEWVLAAGEFSIVQSRPITALPQRTGEVPQDWPVPSKGFYFRASITEQLPDPLTPLFAGLMATAVPTGLNRLLAELAPGQDFGDVGFPTINGYAFYRYSYQAMGRMLRLFPSTFTLLSGGGAMVEERWRQRLADYSAEVAAEAALVGTGMPARTLLDAVGRLVDAMAYYYTAVQTIIPVASMAELSWLGVYGKLLRHQGDPAPETFVLGYDSEPIRAERSLYDLSRWVLEHPHLAAVLADATTDVFANQAPDGVGASTWAEWQRRFGAHLAAHGHTLYNLDFVNPVPADDPAPVLQALRFNLTAEAPDPYARQRAAASARENAAARLLSRLSGWRADRVRQLLTWAQHTGPLREDALAAMGLYVPPARQLLAELGGRLVEAGALAEPMDVCWLTLSEARESADALDADSGPPAGMAERVAERQAAARGQRLARPPQYLPKSRLMDSMDWMLPAREDQSGDVLNGNAGSGGVVTARARVLSGPTDFAAFQPGEVLVAAITTPAYTPLFAMAAGVVTDIGGVLSHGSIVAREYGIPAVLGTGSATRLISTGDEITVDGAAGKVFLAGAGAEPVVQPTDARKWLAGAGALALVAAAVAGYAYRRRRR
ncbi:MAG: phosphoenolpyruvate synthase [Propionibacteriaceae bacterium]|nr:phosphoenolpyruvate synthase [Propionibacteriaceae bacterium]